MEKLAENDLTYFYLRHVVIVVTAVTTISLTPVMDVQYICVVIYDRYSVVITYFSHNLLKNLICNNFLYLAIKLFSEFLMFKYLQSIRHLYSNSLFLIYFVRGKGNNSCKHVLKRINFIIKSGMYKRYIPQSRFYAVFDVVKY
jgi:hypothetical protein